MPRRSRSSNPSYPLDPLLGQVLQQALKRLLKNPGSVSNPDVGVLARSGSALLP
jgi:hypothetical protein